MKAQLQRLLKQLAGASPAAKACLALGALAILGVLVVAGTNARRPAFRLLYSGLDAAQAAAVQNALAGGAIRYEISQPPGPFVVHVEEAKYYDAQNAVALSSALESAPSGIQANAGGAAQVFLSAPERAQSALKREWQEMESQLEVLDFVRRARVSTSTADTSPLRKAPPPTVAVTLELEGGAELSREQASTVAKLVRFRFNVPSTNVMISDQSGRSLYDGTEETDLGAGGDDLLELAQRYDGDVARRTNAVLDRVFGEGRAYVVVNTDWTWDERETVTEKLDPKGVVVSESKTKSETPQEVLTAEGGPAGVASNLAQDFGTSTAAVPGGSTKPAAPPVATSSEETKESLVGRQTELTRSKSPSLERLSVSLFLDQSLEASVGALEQSVKTSVGFDAARGDLFSSMLAPFASLERDEQGNLVPPAPAEPVEEPSAAVELLIQHGVEILAALAFLFVLLKTLKGSASGLRKTPDAARPATAAVAEDVQALELLAKSQIEELVKTDPDRVSSILSRWAAEEATART